MPQASDRLQRRMGELFGSDTGDEGPIKFLETAGYTLNRDWTWVPKAGVKELWEMTQDELACLQFLVEEWDFGGLMG